MPRKSTKKSLPRKTARPTTPPRRRAPTPPKGAPSAKRAKGAPSANRAGAGVKKSELKSRKAFLKRRQRAEIYVTPPRKFKRGPKPKPARAIVITSFKARGTVRSRFGRSPGAMVAKERARERYFILQSEAPEGYPNAPGVWASNESLFLGQVNFPGRVPLKQLLKMLNESLGLVDRRGRLGDFRKVYRKWSFKYQVFEKIGEKRVVSERVRDSS